MQTEHSSAASVVPNSVPVNMEAREVVVINSLRTVINKADASSLKVVISNRAVTSKVAIRSLRMVISKVFANHSLLIAVAWDSVMLSMSA